MGVRDAGENTIIGSGCITEFSVNENFIKCFDEKISNSPHIINKNEYFIPNPNILELIDWLVDKRDLIDEYKSRLSQILEEDNLHQDFYACLTKLVNYEKANDAIDITGLKESYHEKLLVHFNAIPDKALMILKDCLVRHEPTVLFALLVDISSEAIINKIIPNVDMTLLMAAIALLEQPNFALLILSSANIDVTISMKENLFNTPSTVMECTQLEEPGWEEVASKIQELYQKHEAFAHHMQALHSQHRSQHINQLLHLVVDILSEYQGDKKFVRKGIEELRGILEDDSVEDKIEEFERILIDLEKSENESSQFLFFTKNSTFIPKLNEARNSYNWILTTIPNGENYNAPNKQ